ncbi:F0F1 ATP synthase subunit epsilon [Bradyrhizobium sp. NP1]|jgi:F-type H+-transporting ATPase subunit epsilon|uniref:F0F1 ATP synthase subunit epsilon n=1 Tax=Bradyrhizobium sp. NP1 TaxID=3049772 RepID=UPI0025A56D18|nr:F0F1 ATP synthase subunit epsilon [Bradyrhizobium sp. NP1]WJR74905.1 F0F1 ATP synthase subunit epsilon [Bradyrhizobium sp. NP1]
MPSFQVSLVRPDALVFSGQADQVDLPGAEGDMGVLAGHAPIVTMLRPGIVKVFASSRDEEFVVMGGVAEFARSDLTILTEAAAAIGEFDVAGLKAQIEERERNLPTVPIGQELDREIAMLDHYRSLHRYLTVTTAA